MSKEYPQNYPSDVVDVLNAMSFSDGADLNVFGSASQRSQQYAADYDGFEIVKASSFSSLARRFIVMIRHLTEMRGVTIGDIKLGSIEEWRILPVNAYTDGKKVYGYNATQSLAILSTMKWMSVAERNQARHLLVDNPTPAQFLAAKDTLKTHILRWTVEEVLDGKKDLPDGSTVSLSAVFDSPTIGKLDTIAMTEGSRYTDFSVVYQFVIDGVVVNDIALTPRDAIQESMVEYILEGEPFKALKRQYSLAILDDNTKEMERILPLLNGDMGRLYMVLSDVKTLIDLLERSRSVPIRTVRFEIDQFIRRLSTVYQLTDYLQAENGILREIRIAVRASRDMLPVKLEGLYQRIHTILTHAATRFIE